MNYSHPKEIMDEIASVTPSYGGISYDRLENGGLQWPCPDKEHPGTTYLHKGKFARGLGKFTPVEYKPAAELPDEEYPFYLTTGRILYHYHGGTMTRRVDGLNELAPSGLLEVNPADAAKLGLEDGEAVSYTHLDVYKRQGLKLFTMLIRVCQSENPMKTRRFKHCIKSS